MINTRLIGSQYEDYVISYLKEKGYVILERNYQNKLGEIDIIAKDVDCIVAIEVKFRTTKSYGDPIEAVTTAKQRKISRTFLMYYARSGYSDDMPCRFDVVGVSGDYEITHIENAFEFVY